MAIGNDGAVVRHFRTLYSVGTLQERTDGQLLEQFATDRDEAAELAFAALVERHGPMVLRVCRGVLADPHDAQDAFQATFLVLVRKARSLWVRDSLGPWLHQVAYRTGSCARSAIARRRRHERRAAKPEHTAGGESAAELERLLHYEIDRLPERYRAPIVLCDLEGRSHEQAARHLGWPVGTVKSRLSRGRERLRTRLLKSGVTPNAGLIATALSSGGPTKSIPAALMTSTTHAAIRFLETQTIVQGATALLTQGVLRSMFVTQCLKTASILLVVGAAVASVGLLAQSGMSGHSAQIDQKPKGVDQAPAFVVKAGKLKVAVVQRGSLETSKSVDVICEVGGGSRITRIVAEGTKVKKGDVIGELDATRLGDQLVNQRVRTGSAKAAFETAQLASEIAELALTEYTEGIFRQDQNALKNEISAAQAAFNKAENRLERTRRARERLNGLLPRNEATSTRNEILVDLDMDDRLESAEQTLVREKMALELAKTKVELLEKYGRVKTTKALQIDVERNHADKLTKAAMWSLEQSTETRIAKQIAACTLRAPCDGFVVYANDPTKAAAQSLIEEGSTVQDGQKIITVFDLSGIRGNFRVREPRVHQIEKNMKVKIRVDAFADRLFTGSVSSVAGRPDPTLRRQQGVTVYPTLVQIDEPVSGLRPGMTAEAEILIAELDNVLSVPIKAVLFYDGKDHVIVKKPGGGLEWREVTLGMGNDEQVEVKAGIKSGETVIVDPISLLSEEDRKRTYGARAKATVPAGSKTPAKPAP